MSRPRPAQRGPMRRCLTRPPRRWPRTEGWAAGLQLAGPSLRGRNDIGAFVGAFADSHRYVLDYLAEEVLDWQSEQMREFLLETSVLGRLSAELCDAVTGRPGSQALLAQAERAGLFVVPLDEVRGWWRYHQPVRRPAPRPPAGRTARPGARTAPERGRLVRGARAGR
jgi:hypothetical protein